MSASSNPVIISIYFGSSKKEETTSTPDRYQSVALSEFLLWAILTHASKEVKIRTLKKPENISYFFL